MEKRPYLNGLAGLKFLAVVMIFVWHSELKDPPVDLGARMCEFFFVSSGLLMAYNYLGRKSVSPDAKASWRFMRQRFLRVWPLHFVMFLLFLVGEKLRHGLFGLREIFSGILNLTLTQAWSWDREIVMDYNGVTWFLSALMFCYLLTPWLLKKLSGTKRQAVVLAAAALGLHIIIEMLIIRWPDIFFFMRLHTTPVLRALEYALGMAAGRLLLEMKKAGRRLSFGQGSLLELLSLAAAIALMIAFQNVWSRSAYSVMMVLLAFVFAWDAGCLSALFARPEVKAVTALEFGVFMIHVFMIRVVRIALPGVIGSVVLRSIIAFVLTLCAAAVYRKVFEPKVSRLTSRWQSSRQSDKM